MKQNTKHRLPVVIVVALATLAAAARARAADYASTVSALGPVAYYRLSNTNPVPTEVPAANQGSLGAAFNGEYQAMAASRGLSGAIVGDSDTAVSITGSVGEQVVVPFSADYNPSGPFTVEFWAKPINNGAGRQTAVISMINGQNAGNGDDRSGWAVYHTGTDWTFMLGFDHSDGATFYHTVMSAPGSVIEDTWQHVAAVYTPSLISIYVNGNLAISQAPAQPVLPNHAAPLILGDRGYTGWDYSGLLDEVAIYTEALTQAEIQSHYANGTNSGRPKPYPDLVQEKTPRLYFRVGEPSLVLPVAANSGSLGSAGDGRYLAGTTPGVPGPQKPAVTGFETTNVAVRFNGTSGSVQIPGLAINSDMVTMVCWLKRDGTQAARAGIMHNRKVTVPEVKATGLGFQEDGLALSYNWEDFGDAYNFNPNFVPPDQAWTFYAVTISAAEQVMFMGTATGLVAATNTFAISPHDFSGTTLEIGWDNYQATRVFRGSIDEFAMFDKTLTYDEVASLYNAALPAILSITRTADPVYEGMSVTFQTSVAGPAPITYQWRKGGTALEGQTGATLVLNNVTTADTGDYDVQATTGGQTLTSPINHLEVLASPPVLTEVPASAVRFQNGTVQFRVAALGTQPFTYEWHHGTDAIAGATGPVLAIPDLQMSDAGDYKVAVSNSLGQQEATATLTVVAPTKFAAAAVDLAPRGYWRLDETAGTVAYDYWGGRDGSYAGTVTNNVPGPRPSAQQGFESANTAYDFNGAGAFVRVPPLNLNKATITMVCWIKPTGTPDDYDGIVFARGGNTVAGLDFQTGGQLGYHWNDDAATYNWGSGLYPAADQWNFAALVVEPTQGTIYLDSGGGTQSAVNEVNHNAEEFDGTLRFGADQDGSRFYLGTIDEVVIYDRALTAQQITKLRDAGFSGTYAPTPPTFVTQPKSETIMVGNAHTLSAQVAGSTPLSFQWKKNGQPLTGAIRSSLSFASALESDTGTYELVVTQGTTPITSLPATLTVKPIPAYLDLPENLVLHLKFDGNYTDASGRNNNGTAVGAPQIVAGKVGSGALHYNTELSGGAVSAAHYVTLGTPNDLKFGPGANFSVAFWIKFTGTPGDLPFFGNTVNSYGDPGIDFAPSWEEGGWSWYISDQAASAWQGIGLYDPVKNTLNDGNWHHLVHIFDRTGDASTYLDGVKVHAASIASAADWDFNVPTTSWNIGQAEGGAYAVAGTFEMDDLGVWRRLLNHYEAQAIYVVGDGYGRSFDTTAPAEVRIQIQTTAGGLELRWSNGTLESSDRVDGGYSAVAGAASPFTVVPGTGNRFYRVRVQ
jgi:hypothetical protein